MVYYKYVSCICFKMKLFGDILPFLNSLLDIPQEMQKFRSFVAIRVLRTTFGKGSGIWEDQKFLFMLSLL